MPFKLSGRIFDAKGSVYLKRTRKIGIDSIRQSSDPGWSGRPNHGSGKRECVLTLAWIDRWTNSNSVVSRKRTDNCRIVMYRQLGEAASLAPNFDGFFLR